MRLYKAAYSGSIDPIPDLERWPRFDVPVLVPPTLKRSIGRPCRNRKREAGEKMKGKRSIAITCTKCSNIGHNSRTCKGGHTAKEKRMMEGKVRQSRKKGLSNASNVT